MMLLIMFMACNDTIDTADSNVTEYVAPEATTREEGWLRGDLHLHTTYSDGLDTVETVVDIGEYLENEDFLTYNPNYKGAYLDFLAFTDHRTVDQNFDPGFISDKLILMPSEEFGTKGHANTPGVQTFVNHDPDSDGVSLADIQAAIENAHSQGALFSPNHLFLEGIPWPWNVKGFDTIEIWNSGWALASTAFSEEELLQWEESYGEASAVFKRGVKEQGGGNSYQSLIFYESLLSRGINVGLVGGSDRHLVVMPAVPTTWVHTKSQDLNGLLDGMRSRHTYVSRDPAATQIWSKITVNGHNYEFGDSIPAGDASIEIRVVKAESGLIRLISGSYVESDDELENTAFAQVLYEQELLSDDELITLELTFGQGDWFYPIVFEPLVPSYLSEAEAEAVYVMADAAMKSGSDPLLIASAVAPLIDMDVIGSPSECDPDDWEADMMQCVTADVDGMATFFAGDRYTRAMNVWIEDNQISNWCVGAIASAVLFE